MIVALIRRSIKARIFVAILLPLLFVQAVQLFAYLEHLNADIRAHYEMTSATIASPFIGSIEKKLDTLADKKSRKEFLEIYGNLKGGLEFSAWLDDYQHLRDVALIDSDGKRLASTTLTEPLPLSRDGQNLNAVWSELRSDSIVVSVPLASDGGALAYLMFRFSDQEVEEKVSDALLVCLTILSLSVAFGGFLAWYISGAITRPINLLTEDSRVLAKGDLNHEISSLDLNNEIGQLANSFRVMRDAIREKVGELALHQNHLEQLVEEKTRELTEAQGELLQQERLSALGKLTATVSHELLNPLGTIKNAIYSLRKMEACDQDRFFNSLDLAERNISRSVSIVEELNSFARVKALICTRTELETWLPDVLEDVDIPGEIDCRIEIEPGLCVSIDQEKFRQVMVNLLTNSVHALQEKETGEKILKVTAVSNDDEFRISVHDSGVGMSEETRGKLFEPLYSTKNFGLGLGMEVVKSITEQHGGKVEVESSEGEGSRVSLVLPMLR